MTFTLNDDENITDSLTFPLSPFLRATTTPYAVDVTEPAVPLSTTPSHSSVSSASHPGPGSRSSPAKPPSGSIPIPILKGIMEFPASQAPAGLGTGHMRKLAVDNEGRDEQTPKTGDVTERFALPPEIPSYVMPSFFPRTPTVQPDGMVAGVMNSFRTEANSVLGIGGAGLSSSSSSWMGASGDASYSGGYNSLGPSGSFYPPFFMPTEGFDQFKHEGQYTGSPSNDYLGTAGRPSSIPVRTPNSWNDAVPESSQSTSMDLDGHSSTLPVMPETRSSASSQPEDVTNGMRTDARDLSALGWISPIQPDPGSSMSQMTGSMDVTPNGYNNTNSSSSNSSSSNHSRDGSVIDKGMAVVGTHAHTGTAAMAMSLIPPHSPFSSLSPSPLHNNPQTQSEPPLHTFSPRSHTSQSPSTSYPYASRSNTNSINNGIEGDASSGGIIRYNSKTPTISVSTDTSPLHHPPSLITPIPTPQRSPNRSFSSDSNLNVDSGGVVNGINGVIGGSSREGTNSGDEIDGIAGAGTGGGVHDHTTPAHGYHDFLTLQHPQPSSNTYPLSLFGAVSLPEEVSSNWNGNSLGMPTMSGLSGMTGMMGMGGFNSLGGGPGGMGGMAMGSDSYPSGEQYAQALAVYEHILAASANIRPSSTSSGSSNNTANAHGGSMPYSTLLQLSQKGVDLVSSKAGSTPSSHSMSTTKSSSSTSPSLSRHPYDQHKQSRSHSHSHSHSHHKSSHPSSHHSVNPRRSPTKPTSPRSKKAPADGSMHPGGNGPGRERSKNPTTCLGCGATETPEWRRGPMGPRTLCNACGLVHMKLQRKKRKMEEKAAAAAAEAAEKGVGMDDKAMT